MIFIALLWPWEPSVMIVIAAALTAVLFVRGQRAIPVGQGRQACFWSGLVLLYGALHTQFDYYAEHEFFIHRLQHAVMHHMGPFLIGLSRPGHVLRAGLPARLRSKRGGGRTVGPVAATSLFVAVLVIWLIPHAQLIAMLDWRWYRVMNWSVVASGLIFWGLAFDPARPPMQRVGMMLAILPPQIAAGALLCLTGHELYPVYSLCGRAVGGLTPVADQALGGVIVWLDGVMMSVLGILIVARRDILCRRAA